MERVEHDLLGADDDSAPQPGFMALSALAAASALANAYDLYIAHTLPRRGAFMPIPRLIAQIIAVWSSTNQETDPMTQTLNLSLHKGDSR